MHDIPNTNIRHIIIVGPHRCGSSALTRALTGLDYSCGKTKLLGPHESNPYGHFEPRELVDINKAVLKAMGHTHLDPPKVEEEPDYLSYKNITKLLEQQGKRQVLERTAQEAWLRTFGENENMPWVWKDPRLSFLLLWWAEVLKWQGSNLLHYPRVLICLRSIETIVKSLSKRDEISTEAARLVTQRHVAACLRLRYHFTYKIIFFENLVANPLDTLKAVALFCGYSRKNISDSQLATAAGLIDPSVVHY